MKTRCLNLVLISFFLYPFIVLRFGKGYTLSAPPWIRKELILFCHYCCILQSCPTAMSVPRLRPQKAQLHGKLDARKQMCAVVHWFNSAEGRSIHQHFIKKIQCYMESDTTPLLPSEQQWRLIYSVFPRNLHWTHYWPVSCGRYFMMAANVTLWGKNLWFLPVVWVTQGAALLLERLFSSLLSLMSTMLLCLQPGVTDISQQFAVIARLQEIIFKMNISPLLLKFNCTGCQSCGYMSGADITLSQLISPEGQLQLVSGTVKDVHLFSKMKCPSTYKNWFFSQPFWSCNTLPIWIVFRAN